MGADGLSVGFVVCAFKKKIQKTKNTQLCVCVCGFWVHSQVELLIIGALMTLCTQWWCTGSSSFTVASFFLVLFRFALCLFVACYYSFKISIFFV